MAKLLVEVCLGIVPMLSSEVSVKISVVVPLLLHSSRNLYVNEACASEGF